VEVKPSDLAGDDVLEGINFQRELERRAYDLALKAGGEAYSAPAQSVGDFICTHEGALNRAEYVELLAYASSRTGNKSRVAPTYPRGTVNCDLHQLFPKYITDAIYEALPKLDAKLHGFASSATVMTAPEARSSSPVRIIRDRQTCESISYTGLYPAGEGAGYAGGIMSAANDGIKVALAIIKKRGELLPQAIQISDVVGSYQTKTSLQVPTILHDLADAIDVLKSGRPLIFETDTVCGLGLSPTYAPNPDVLFTLKTRSDSKPVAWLISSVGDLSKYGDNIPDYAWVLARKFWPGGLSIIVNASNNVPAAFASRVKTIGLRMPNSRSALELIESLGSPIATTSANVSGAAAVKSAHDVSDELGCKVATYLPQKQRKTSQANKDGEGEIFAAIDAISLESQSTCASTVVDCTGQTPKILREGSISAKQIERVIKEG
jgi:tRNA threonylcarbamoyl adenosine modification protein (Sua5/YciO/YrdC/YwlC family)